MELVRTSVFYIPPPFCCTSFNQQKKKACLSVVSSRDATTAVAHAFPTLMQTPDKNPANQEEKRHSVTLTPSPHHHHPPTHLRSSIPFPCLLFISSSHFSEVRTRKTPALINFSLLIFVCISCFVWLDVLIELIWFRVCFVMCFLC